MTKTISNHLIFGLPILILLFLVALVNSPWFALQPEQLSYGVTLDLLVTIPFIYFLIIRKRNIPKISIISVFIVCLIIASFLIPQEHQSLLSAIKTYGLPIAEFAILGYLALSTRKIIQQFKHQKNATPDFYTAISMACKAALPKRIATLFATEISVMYYAFFAWKKRPLQKNEYSYSEKNTIIVLLYVVIFLILFETFVVHLLLMTWNETFAWILMALSIYTAIQFFALARSLPKRPIHIDVHERKLHLIYGIFNRTSIDINDIKDIEQSTKMLPADKSIIQFSPLGNLDNHNIIIHLHNKNILYKIYGLQKRYTSIAVYVDDKDRFVEDIRQLMT